MTQSTIELRKLQAEDGMVLTNGEMYSSVGGVVYLGVNDSVSNWYEISKEEYDKRIKELEQENYV